MNNRKYTFYGKSGERLLKKCSFAEPPVTYFPCKINEALLLRRYYILQTKTKGVPVIIGNNVEVGTMARKRRKPTVSDRVLWGVGVPWYITSFANMAAAGFAVPVAIIKFGIVAGAAFLIGSGAVMLLQWLASFA